MARMTPADNACYDWTMVEMYMWLLVTVVVAVGVLVLAGVLAPRDGDDRDDRDAPTSAWGSLWHDFLSGTSPLRDRIDALRHRGETRSPHGTATPRVSVLNRDFDPGRRRVGQASGPHSAPASAASADGSSWFDLGPAESNTSVEEFFAATATSEPAYLDAAQLSDALNSLRR